MRISPDSKRTSTQHSDPERNNDRKVEGTRSDAEDAWSPSSQREALLRFVRSMATTSEQLTKAFNDLSIRIAAMEPGALRDEAIKEKDDIARVIDDLDVQMLKQGKAIAESQK